MIPSFPNEKKILQPALLCSALFFFFFFYFFFCSFFCLLSFVFEILHHHHHHHPPPVIFPINCNVFFSLSLYACACIPTLPILPTSPTDLSLSKASQVQTKNKATKFSLSQVIVPNNLHRSDRYTPLSLLFSLSLSYSLSFIHTLSSLYFQGCKGTI